MRNEMRKMKEREEKKWRPKREFNMQTTKNTHRNKKTTDN